MPAYNGPKKTTSRRLQVRLTTYDEANLALARDYLACQTESDTVRHCVERVADLAIRQCRKLRGEPEERAPADTPRTQPTKPSAPSTST